MKKLTELSANELTSIIANAFPEIDIHEESAMCAVCGNIDNAEYIYICDGCENTLR